MLSDCPLNPLIIDYSSLQQLATVGFIFQFLLFLWYLILISHNSCWYTEQTLDQWSSLDTQIYPKSVLLSRIDTMYSCWFLLLHICSIKDFKPQSMASFQIKSHPTHVGTQNSKTTGLPWIHLDVGLSKQLHSMLWTSDIATSES